MKLKINKNNIVILAVQLTLAAVLVFGIPLVNQMMMSQKLDLRFYFGMTMPWIMPMILVYFANFYIFVPFFYEKKKRPLFLALNILLIGLLNMPFIFFLINFAANSDAYLHANQNNRFVENSTIFMHASQNVRLTIIIVMNLLMIGFAIGMHYIMKLNRMEMELNEIKQKNTEAELSWLKNQLNPHFLFNALNNISSLTQIDADQAQDSIAQLSDLLRYAMYETRSNSVTIGKDVDFMINYIEMMKLRCSDKTTVSTSFNITNREAEISPMLFISFIENAFKHGVSNTHQSFIDIRLTQNADELIFECSNSDFHKTTNDRSGQGVGLANTKRRLELLYKNRFTWNQESVDGVFKIEIRIK